MACCRLGRHLTPSRQHIILDVVSLLRGHPPPDIFFRSLVRFLLRSHTIPLVELLSDLVLLFRRHPLEGGTTLEEPFALRQAASVAHLEATASARRLQLLPRRQISALRIIRSRASPLIWMD